MQGNMIWCLTIYQKWKSCESNICLIDSRKTLEQLVIPYLTYYMLKFRLSQLFYALIRAFWLFSLISILNWSEREFPKRCRFTIFWTFLNLLRTGFSLWFINHKLLLVSIIAINLSNAEKHINNRGLSAIMCCF